MKSANWDDGTNVWPFLTFVRNKPGRVMYSQAAPIKVSDAAFILVPVVMLTPKTKTLRQPGRRSRFDHILSVEAVRSCKPAAAPYHHAAEVAGVEPSQLLMVACHDWDLAGARAAGCTTAFIRRPAMSYANTFPAPEYSAADFADLADQLLG